MNLRLRYLCALVVNVALPWLAYRLAFPHLGNAGALAASALPLIAWMIWDWLAHRHVDALSALVLVGIALSLIATTTGADAHMRALEEPLVPGMIGLAFLVSLALPRPLVFYLARSTQTREDPHSARDFEQRWRTRPVFAGYIRLMTLVWGLGMIGENLLRMLVVWHWPDDTRAVFASEAIRYGVYGALMLWTFWCRRRIRQDALRYTSDANQDKAADSPFAR